MRLTARCALIAAAFALCACGQSGDLYLPEDAPATPAPATAPAAEPAPTPEPERKDPPR